MKQFWDDTSNLLSDESYMAPVGQWVKEHILSLKANGIRFYCLASRNDSDW